MDPAIEAVILDLDGVITRTATLHAAAWKELFDSYNRSLRERGERGYEEFQESRDYHLYVDGKPRQDGVRDFLQSRGITLPMGHPADSIDRETLHGLANLKNTFFAQALKQKGPEVFVDAVTAIQAWRQQGFKIAVASSSKNCREVLQIAGIEHLFDARVDGTHLELWNMPGKPAPDMFLAAARELGVAPERAAVIEDAIAGIQAARAGNFALAIGVARLPEARDSLRSAGAHIVVDHLTDLTLRKIPLAA